MIDLRKKALPSRLTWDGGACKVNTDFRIWIEFGEYLKQGLVFLGIFPGNKPPVGDEWQRAAVDFYRSPNIVPRATRTASNMKAIDYITDGEFIVASFQQAYGIDLTSCDMHWHRFKALLDGLPDNTKMAKIMGYRMWTPASDKQKHNDFMAEQRAAWALPMDEPEDDMGGFGALIASVGGL